MSGGAGKAEPVLRLLREGRVDQAHAACLRLARANPNDAGLALLMSDLCAQRDEIAPAAHWANRAAEIAPRDPEVLARAGYAWYVAGESAKAETVLTRALTLVPMHARARATMANVLAEGRRFTAMLALAREGWALDPANAELGGLVAGALLNLGRASEAAGVLRDLGEAHPDNAGLAGGLAMVLNYVPEIDPAEVSAAHRRFGELLARSVPAGAFVHANTREPDRRLRVGLVSPDLRSHSVAWFVEPILRHHDAARLEMVVYQTNHEADAVTARLRPLADAWHVMDRATDAMLAQYVHADGVDVLLELSGLTHGHSLGAMRQRPAPVQMTYLGYPNTTGLRTIDWRLVDSQTDPPGAEALATERLLRLDPCFLCYQPPGEAPPPSVRSAGPVVFGSFNTAQKINDVVLAMWVKVLDAVPGSRLVLKSVNFEDGPLRDDVRARFVACGGDSARLDVLPPQKERGGHLAAYGGLDIALDPVPYAGTTTTCEALWMGVPVVTLAGQAHAGRVGASLLAAVGRGEWVAKDEAEYVRIAAGLAADAARRSHERTALREAMVRSPLCDGPGFAERFEHAVRSAWRDWCANHGPPGV